MICYYFYKNVVLVFTEFYFAIFNGFSGQIFFLDWLPMLYNAVYTSWHCLFAMLLEKDTNDHYSFRYPQLYKAGQLGKLFNYGIFWQWVLAALWHGLVCFSLPMFVNHPGISGHSDKQGEHWLSSTVSFTLIIHLVFYKLLIETTHFNLITLLTGVLSMLLYYGTILLFQIPALAYLLQPQLLGIVSQMVRQPAVWLILIATPWVALVPDIVGKALRRTFKPDPVDKVLLEMKEYPEYDFREELQEMEELIQRRKLDKHVVNSQERKDEIRKMKTMWLDKQGSGEAQEDSESGGEDDS